MPALRATRPSPAARCLARPGPGALALRITARGLAALGVGTGTSPDVAVTSGATISYALETDWPVEAAGFEPLHSGIEIRQTLSLGGGISKLCISKSDLLNLIPPQRVLGVDRARL